ncbi:hypothetical protein F4804DRAFT_110881 [Jackrogersella minutella]|nr:hypothetical protein F4804DRAFT_110881 [Jackrogersella minutella]
MKTNFASALAFAPLLTVVSAYEISDVYKKTLGNSDCTNIHLTEGHVLRANCVNPGYNKHMDFNLDLNTCFANYLGTLNQVPNGGFGGSCSPCAIDGTKLTCECSGGKGRSKRHNEVELNDWNVIQIQDGYLTCGNTDGLEKRASNKEARFFLA